MTQAAAKRTITTPAFATDDNRWAAVVTHDAAADGRFVYSVETTGVYCRPSCGARRPRRANVRFHSTAEAAERAGFRPCKRCRPRDANPVPGRAAMIAEACRIIESSEEPPSLDTLSAAAGLSRYHFHRTFKAVTGVTPKAYVSANRARRLRDGLKDAASVTDAVYGAGYGSSGRFYAAPEAVLGMTPSAYRKGGRGEQIRFAAGECSLGAVVVAATEKGICAILLGDDPDALVRDLQDRFPKARLAGGDAAFEAWVAAVVGFIDDPRIGLGLPLDIRGTAFQQRVWRALTNIPPGTTVTYTDLAARLGLPRAVRAVASACAANRIAVAIPCHRVVRRDGGLAGYRWGVERKRALLAREGASRSKNEI
ncbi:MAG: bifunctional DNA-binding transcriptional regulator/O6-methylguanine-DNA methyltransferase Ada [Alphaproteobacteria bacterium]